MAHCELVYRPLHQTAVTPQSAPSTSMFDVLFVFQANNTEYTCMYVRGQDGQLVTTRPH